MFVEVKVTDTDQGKKNIKQHLNILAVCRITVMFVDIFQTSFNIISHSAEKLKKGHKVLTLMLKGGNSEM